MKQKWIKYQDDIVYLAQWTIACYQKLIKNILPIYSSKKYKDIKHSFLVLHADHIYIDMYGRNYEIM